MNKPIQREKGLALVLAMMIVAIIAAIGVELMWRFDLNFSRGSHRLQGLQGRAYLQSVEVAMSVFLKQDRDESDNDHLGEEWAQIKESMGGGFPLGDAVLFIKDVRDAQGLFNINTLIGKVPPANPAEPPLEPWQEWTTAQRRFIRLLQTIPDPEFDDATQTIDIDQARTLTRRVMDWLDRDDLPHPVGDSFESDFYAQREEGPVSIANGPMTTVSELRLVEGFAPIYEQLKDLVIALPPDQGIELNVNTAPEGVLAVLNFKENLQPTSADPSSNVIDSLIQARELEAGDQLASGSNTGGIAESDLPNELEQAFSFDPLSNKFDENFDVGGLNVATHYFILEAEVMLGDGGARYQSQSLLHRDDSGKVTVLWRTDTNF